MTISQSEVRPAKLVNSSHNLASSSSRRRFSSSSWLSRVCDDLSSGVRRPEGSDWRAEEEVSEEVEDCRLVLALWLREVEAEAGGREAAAEATASSSSRRCFSRSSSLRATSSSTAFAILS